MNKFCILLCSFFLAISLGISSHDINSDQLAATILAYNLPYDANQSYNQPYGEQIYGSQFQSSYTQHQRQPRTPSDIYYSQRNVYNEYSPPILRTAPPLYHNPNPNYGDVNYNFLPPPPQPDYSFPDSSRTNQLYWYLQNT